MIDLNKTASPEQEPSNKSEVEILKAKLRKTKRAIKSKNRQINNLKTEYNNQLLAKDAEIKFDNIMLIFCAIMFALMTFSNSGDLKKEQSSQAHQVNQIHYDVPKNPTEISNGVSDEIIKKNSKKMWGYESENSHPLSETVLNDPAILNALISSSPAVRSEMSMGETIVQFVNYKAYQFGASINKFLTSDSTEN